MPFSDDVKLKAQDALKRYLEGDYPPNVKNPILLLNYLNQHAIIPRPNYNAIYPADTTEHAISCKIGELEMIGSGNTNKVAKTRAAQLFLDFLLDMNNVSYNSVNGDTTQSFHSLQSSIARENFNGDSVPEKYNFSSMKHCIPNRVSEEFIIEGENNLPMIYLEPQYDSDSVVLDGENGQRTIYVDSECDLSDSDVIIGENGQHTIYADPQCELPDSDSSQTSSNVSVTEAQPSSMAHEQPSCDNYFDPFSKQRPQGYKHEYIMETENITNITNNVQKSEPDPVNVTVDKSNGNVDGKNVFATLQKKTQKHLKLIPRFRIENVESGFQCSVQLGSYYALGEGRNKKIAKTNAAVNLLNQISHLN